MLAIFLTAAADLSAIENPQDVVVTASRTSQKREDAAASVEVIDSKAIESLGEPLAQDLLRLIPSTSVSSSGPPGTLTQVRIRGAEANHTLLFIDGIKANDPAFGDEAHFELLNGDLPSRIEVVRGPQSALWGSQAIGGVIAVDGPAGSDTGYGVHGEVGSFGFTRASASASVGSTDAQVSGALGWQHARGIDVSGTQGEDDGYRNLSGRILASWKVAPGATFGVNGFALAGESQFDGNDPFTFAPTQDLSTKFALTAGRVWGRFDIADGLGGSLSASLLNGRNINRFQDDETNRTVATRRTLSGQLQYAFDAASFSNEIIAAAEFENEHFKARDSAFGGLSRQNRDRRHDSLTGEWRAKTGPLVADVALRRDAFSGFKDTTTVRASLLAHVRGGFSLTGSYGEGIAPPSFTEQFGFFPGSFIGNPDLKPERSRGYEFSLRYGGRSISAALTGYSQHLRDELVTVFDPTFRSTTINRDASSRRSGFEAEFGWQIAERLRLNANYSFLHATEPMAAGGHVEEVRRPKHSGSVWLDGSLHKLTYGASLAYVGRRSDVDFDVFPAATVQLDSYWLAGARVAYPVTSNVELFARGSNLLGQHYQDVFRFRTEGRGLFVGLKLADRRS